MNKTNPHEPLNCNNGDGYWKDEMNKTHAGVGLTKLEYFAAMAMQGFISANKGRPYQNEDDKDCASQSVKFAKALIEELNK